MGEDVGVQEAATIMQDTLLQTHHLASSDAWRQWTLNCGCHVSHHSGPHAAAISRGLVCSKPRRSAKSHATAKAVKLTMAGEPLLLQPGAATLAKVRRHMEAHRKHNTT